MKRCTLEELNQLAYLPKAISFEKRRLLDLQDQAGSYSSEAATEIIETIRRYEDLLGRCRDFINSVKNPRVRTILQLRYMDQKSWQEIADYIDNGEGKEKDYTVKQAAYRFIEGMHKPTAGN